MKEKEFWEKIRPFIQKHTKYYERIENRVNQGTPDVFCLSKNLQPIWIELKTVKDLLQRPKFQPQQPIWHKIYASRMETASYWLIAKTLFMQLKALMLILFLKKILWLKISQTLKTLILFFGRLFSDLEN